MNKIFQLKIFIDIHCVICWEQNNVMVNGNQNHKPINGFKITVPQSVKNCNRRLIQLPWISSRQPIMWLGSKPKGSPIEATKHRENPKSKVEKQSWVQKLRIEQKQNPKSKEGVYETKTQKMRSDRRTAGKNGLNPIQSGTIISHYNGEYLGNNTIREME